MALNVRSRETVQPSEDDKRNVAIRVTRATAAAAPVRPLTGSYDLVSRLNKIYFRKIETRLGNGG